MTVEDGLHELHPGISRRKLWHLVCQTGGMVEILRRKGEYHVRYPWMPAPSGLASVRRKDVGRKVVAYVREALERATGGTT